MATMILLLLLPRNLINIYKQRQHVSAESASLMYRTMYDVQKGVLWSWKYTRNVW